MYPKGAKMGHKWVEKCSKTVLENEFFLDHFSESFWAAFDVKMESKWRTKCYQKQASFKNGQP